MRLFLTLLAVIALLASYCVPFVEVRSVEAQTLPQDSEAPQVIIKYNPTGTHIKDEHLKVRFDIYYGEGSKIYDLYYVDVLD